MESGTKMPGSVNKGRDEVKFKDMRYAGVIFSQKASVGFLPEDGSRKSGEGGFMAVDIEVQKGNVALLFVFLSERNRRGLSVQKVEEEINVFRVGKEQECLIYITQVKQWCVCLMTCAKPLLFLDSKECIAKGGRNRVSHGYAIYLHV